METLKQAGQFPQPAQLTAAQRDLLIMEWDEAKKELEHFKAKEMALRLQLNADAAMFDPLVEKGTLNFMLGNGFKLSCVRKININVENKNGEAFTLMEELDKSEDPVIKHLAKDLFKWSPELRVSKLVELEAHDAATAKRVRMILTEKQASPEMKLIEPK
jgi:hypothetical protein